MGNREAQGRRGASQLHLVKLLRLTHPIGREGLGTQGYEVDGQSSEAQLQDTHVIFAYLRRVVKGLFPLLSAYEIELGSQISSKECGLGERHRNTAEGV